MKIKKRLIEGGVLAVIFVVAVAVFSFLTNKGNDSMTADMSSATLPQVSFAYNGYNLNVLPGYVEEMEITSMRDTITPVTNGKLTVNISDYGNEIKSLDYQVYTLDGKKQLKEGVVKKTGESVDLDLEKPDSGKSDDSDDSSEDVMSEERVLKLTLMKSDGSLVYYYTRIRGAKDTGVLKCLDYTNKFHESALAKDDDGTISGALETGSDGDDSTFQHVNINSGYNQVTWGKLKPELTNGMRWNVKEITENYTSVELEYQVNCKGEENDTDLYNVKEFFRVRYASDSQETYLLNYDRVMDQVFDPTKQVLSEKGILLGINSSDVQYRVNKNGTIVSFVAADELWTYNKKTDEMSKVFSFADAEKSDIRNLNPKHEIKILDIDKTGNTTFAVYGYMNRGEHEGEVGVAIYYFDISKNSVDERVFISSQKSYENVDQELGKLVYYNINENTLYAMVNGALYDYNVTFDDKKAIVENLEDGQYVVSSDSSLVAYQSNGDLNNATEIAVMDLSNEKTQTAKCESDECIRPLGFIKTDFVYGVAKTADIGKSASGESIVPMYKVEIMNKGGEIVKTYSVDGSYILGATFEDNMITLDRATKNGDTYVSSSSDYITNNEEKKESNISLESYVTDLKETQIRLTYNDGIADKNPKVLNPKQVLFENPVTVSFDDEVSGDKYYVYAYGTLQGIYDKAGTAIVQADKYSGVVVSADQQYVWERGNRDLVYSIDSDAENLKDLRNRLKSGEAPVDAISAMNNKKCLDLTGCTAEELLYVINQGNPVVAMLDSNSSVILIGYTDSDVTYMDVSSGETAELTYDELNEKTKGSGHTYVGFQK